MSSNNQSRTYNSIRNGLIAIIFYFGNLLLQFISRKVFIEHLGAELLGLNTTIVSILQFLNIAEMGVGTAVACTLYAPLNRGDQEQINDIVSLHGWLYRNIAIFIFACSVLLLPLFPQIFSKSDIPIGYAYLTYLSLLFSSLLGYIVNYKQILLSANQQEYKIQLSYKLMMLFKFVAQIVVVQISDNGYVWWMCMEIVFAILSAFTLHIAVKRTFPQLKADKSNGRLLRKQYPEVTTKVTQLFFHKIASFALSQLSPIVIYTYATLALVANYGNYMLVITGLVSLFTALFNGLNASVGNLVASADKKKILRVFSELFSIRFVLVATCSLILYILMEPFITLWVGEDYLLPRSSLILIVVIFYLSAMRSVVDSFLHAYGLFKDVWAPITEACLNIGLSFLFGYYFGLEGVLLGVIISLFAIVFLWKPYFLFSQGICVSIKKYIYLYAKHIVVLGITSVMFYYILPVFKVEEIINWGQFFWKGVGLVLSVGVVLGGLTYIVEQGMRDFMNRMLRILTRR